MRTITSPRPLTTVKNQLPASIKNVQQACDLIEKLKVHIGKQEEPKFYNFPFGMWFRGHANSSYALLPSVFRKTNNQIFEETSKFYHFKSQQPEYRQTHHDTFDWLCLMQHYGLPTRLLDWTGSILVALYFVVRDHRNDDKDGRLYVLDAKKLAWYTRLSTNGISVDDSDETRIISKMSADRILKELIESLQDSYPHWTQKYPEEALLQKIRDLCVPIPVLPNRLNHRMVFQRSVFTLHGGKILINDTYKEPIPPPVTLEDLNNEYIEDNFLIDFLIRKEDKPALREQLFNLEIHEGSLFPELENQAKFLKELWSF